jgi:hypothetical protein
VAGDSCVFDTLGQQVQGKLSADSRTAADLQPIRPTVVWCNHPSMFCDWTTAAL